MSEQSKQFIKICNVSPLVNALEGGVIELETLLDDYIKYLKNPTLEGVMSNIAREKRTKMQGDMELLRQHVKSLEPQTDDGWWNQETPEAIFAMGELALASGAEIEQVKKHLTDVVTNIRNEYGD